jgi:23S rRNA-/tRNA-specific pseudouridylate synthase
VSALAERLWTSLPLGRDVQVLTHDVNGLGALAKPAGILSHPNEPGEEVRSLINARYVTDGEYFEWKSEHGQPIRLWLLNRLDSATSGVILAAATAELAEAIRLHFRQKQVRKIYGALVFGTPAPRVQVWRDFLVVEKRAGKIRTEAQGNVPSESRMTVVRTGSTEPRVALIQLEPKTGRSHQLRVQCAKRKLPIVGDQTYGNFPRNREFAKAIGSKRLFLHSTETSFDYEYRGKTFHFLARAPLPPEFEAQL